MNDPLAPTSSEEEQSSEFKEMKREVILDAITRRKADKERKAADIELPPQCNIEVDEIDDEGKKSE